MGLVRQIQAGLLDVGYVDAGSADGPAVVLLHGWPYDIHTFAEVSPLLAAAGHRVIVPYLRGYGTTRFLADETVRNGQQSALAVDAIAVMDALGTTEVEDSHVIMISRPDVVADVINTAAGAVSRPVAASPG